MRGTELVRIRQNENNIIRNIGIFINQYPFKSSSDKESHYPFFLR